MKAMVLAACLILGLSASGALACGEEQPCKIDVAGGKPVPLYADPQGAAVSTIENGKLIFVIQQSEGDGAQRMQIARFTDSWGYVLADKLACDTDTDGPICTIANPDGASLPTYEEPAKNSTGAFENGLRVRPFETVVLDGAKWFAVEYMMGDNEIGWVDASSVNCEYED